MILDRYSEDLFFLEDFECLQINQEHFVKISALLKQVVVDEMVNMGNISLQQQTGLYFVCTGAYDPKSRQTFTFSGEYPKTSHNFAWAEETFKVGAARFMLISHTTSAVRNSIQYFSNQILWSSSGIVKKPIFSHISAPISIIIMILNDAVQQDQPHVFYDYWYAGKTRSHFKHE